MLYAFNLNELETLNVWCQSNSGEHLRLNNLSTRLTALTLKKFRLTSDQVSKQKARSLPNLVTLRLIGMTLEGPLRNYLELPKLSHIEMDGVEFFGLNGNPESDEDEEYRPILLSDMLLSPKPSSLESIALINISIDKSFIQELRSYPNLRALAFKGGNLDDLFQTFFSNLDPNTGFFPALREIEMEVTWPSSIDMSYEEFADYCASRSPHRELYGQIRVKSSLK
ncbi:hypothetical protein CPB86DRAFT_818513 [Serendipita vermifera]|nr:hypothetical protein CPB86DRAFT_818513 [Serendipita vermifera]